MNLASSFRPGDANARGGPFVSVVVPVYNGEETIGACLQALLTQDYPPEQFEVLVVDNNSTDGTPAIVQRSGLTPLFERRVQSSYAARNLGVRQARGEIVAFTDADCVPQPQWLEQLVTAFFSDDIVGVVGAIQPTPGKTAVAQFLAQTHPVRSQMIGQLWHVVTANVAFRRDTLIAVGLFREMRTSADVDLGLRLQLGGYGRIAYASEAVVRHSYEDSWPAIWRRFRRYGYAEALLGRRDFDTHQSIFSPAYRRARIAQQVRALITYGPSFVWRLREVPRGGWVPERNAWPLLAALAESANLWGKLQGYWAIRTGRVA